MSSTLKRDSLLYLGAKVLPGLLNFAAVAIYTRMATPAVYGQFMQVLASQMIGQMLLSYWLRLSLVRWYSQHLTDDQRLISTVRALNVITQSIVIVLGGIAWLVLPRDLGILVVAGVTMFVTQNGIELSQELQRSQMRSRDYAICAAARAVLALAFTVVFLKLNFGFWSFIGGRIVSGLLPWIPEYKNVWRKYRAEIDPALAKSLLAYGLPLLGTYILDLTLGTVTKLQVGGKLGSEAIGVFSANFDFANTALYMMFHAINLAVFPMVSRAIDRDDKPAALSLLKRSHVAMIGLTLPVLAVFVFFPQQLSAVVFGHKFWFENPLALSLLGLGCFCWALKIYYFDLAFQFGMRTSQQIIPNAISAVLAFLGVQYGMRYGLVGVSIAVAGSQALALLFAVWQGRSVLKLPWDWRSAGMALGAVCLIAIPFRLQRLPIPAFIELALYMVVAFGVLLGVNYAGSRDLITRRLKRRARTADGV